MQHQNRDFLWEGIPTVFHKDKFIIFSPYAKETIEVKEEELRDPTLKKRLKKRGFFGTPKNKPSTDRLTVMLYLTSACNLKCIYCFDAKEECPLMKAKILKGMEPETAINYLKTIIKEHEKLSPGKEIKLTIHFFGGEPTLRRDTVKEVVKFLEEKNIAVKYRISTNGVTNEENILYMINKKFLFDIACDGKPEIHDKQRPSKAGFKSSEYTEKMIKLLVKHKAKVRTKVVVTKESTPHMIEAVEYLADLGIDLIRLEAVLIDGRGKENDLGINIEEFTREFILAGRKAVELRKKYNRNIRITNRVTMNLFEPRKTSCMYTEGNNIIINAEGKISKCIRNIHSEETSPFVIGKINNSKLDINSKKLEFLTNLNVDKMDKCKDCFAKYVCAGDCPNENFEENGDMRIPKTTNCKFTKRMLHEIIIEINKKLTPIN